MAKAYVRAEVQQAGVRGEVDRPDIQTERPSRPEDQCRVPDRIGCRKKDQPPGLTGQAIQALHVLVLDALGEIPHVRKGKPASELGCT